MQNYFTMLCAPAPLDALSAPEGVSRVMDLIPDFWLRLIMYTIFFALIYSVTPWLLRKSVGSSFTEMTERDRRFFASSVSALPHHAYVIMRASGALITLIQTGTYDAAALASVAPLTLAYFSVDLVAYAIPERDMVFLAHHLLGIAIAANMCILPLPLLRWVPHLLVTETSTPVLLLGRALRKAGLAGSLLSRTNDALVILTFFFTRVINMPFAFAVLLWFHPKDAYTIGSGGIVFVALLCVLQFYWFFLKLMPSALGLTKKINVAVNATTTTTQTIPSSSSSSTTIETAKEGKNK